MQLKPGVRLLGLRPEMVVALIAANDAWRAQGVELVVTSCIDGTHSRSSSHYTGCALDFRSRDLTKPDLAVGALQAALGADYDVVLETDHIHVEFDPKSGY